MIQPRKLIFATLGPTGSNHEFVMHRYLAFHGLQDRAVVELILDFHDAARRLIAGEIDYLMQVAVHPDATTIVATYRHAMFVIDAFVSGSRNMAVVCRNDIAQPAHIALQPATLHYIDASRYGTVIPEVSMGTIAQGLIEGRYEAGLTVADLAEERPDRFRILESVGAVDDPWMVFGRKRVANGATMPCRDSPAARLFAESA